MNAVTPYGEVPKRVTEGPDTDAARPLANYEAEQALLGTILGSAAAYDRVAEFLRPEHFADPVHGRIFAASARLIESGRPANPVTLKNLFDQDAALADIGGSKYLVDLVKVQMPVSFAADYAGEIVALAKRRALISSMEMALSEARIVDPDAPIDNQIGALEAKLSEIQAIGLVGEEATPIGKAVTDAIERAKSAFQNGAKSTGIQSGIAALDHKIGGFHPGNLVIMAGRPSMGKTALAECIADNIAAAGAGVLFFSLEMTRDEIGERFIARETGITVDRQRKGEVGGLTDFDVMLEAQQRFGRIPLFIDDTPAITIAQLRARARRAVRRDHIDVIMVDYLGLMQPAQRRQNGSRNDDVGEISRGLKALAKELRKPVIALSQLSRANESRDDKRPQLSDLRDSGSLEQDADVVVFVHREEYYLDRQQPKPKAGEDEGKFSSRLSDWHVAMAKVTGRAELIVSKNRQGPVGIVEVAFDGPRTLFKDI
jgi:replicative DNA helicase